MCCYVSTRWLVTGEVGLGWREEWDGGEWGMDGVDLGKVKVTLFRFRVLGIHFFWILGVVLASHLASL